MQGVDLIITITDRSRAEQFASWFRSHGISLVLTALGRGTATTEVLDFLGLISPDGAPGGPGAVAGHTRTGRFDDGSGEQHRRSHRQGISAA